MIGNDQIRFCEHCNLSVHNFSELNQKQILRLVEKSEGRICAQYVRRPNAASITARAEKLHQIARRVSRVAAGAFTATLSVTGAAAQSPSTPADSSPPVTLSVVRWTPGASVSGTITDSSGARVPGASISISNEENNVALYTSANHLGEYRIEGLASGGYKIRVEAPGFAPAERASVWFSENTEMRVDQTLEPDTIKEIQATEEERTISFSGGGAVVMIAPSDPFILAAQRDDLALVTTLLAGRDVNLRDKSSQTTALEHAVKNANREMVQLLISAGANVNLKDNSGETPLMMLDADATSDLVWDLINAGAKVNASDTSGNTPLMEAASVNNLELLKTLLEAGADVNAKNKNGKTALMMAASEGLVNNLRTLILAGAKVNAVDAEGKNALYYATDSGNAALRLLRTQGSEEVVAIKREDP
jgi:hypothetical protein